MLCTLDHSIAEVIDVDDYVRVLCNPVGVSIRKDMASQCNYVVPSNGNIIPSMSNFVLADKEKCVDVDAKCVARVKEVDESETISKQVSSLDVAFEVYDE